MSEQVSFVVELAVEPGELDEFKALMAELIESARAESGTLAYEFFVSEDGGAVHVYERYADSAAILVHAKTLGEKYGARLMAVATPKRTIVFGTPSAEAQKALSMLGPTYLEPLGGFSR